MKTRLTLSLLCLPLLSVSAQILHNASAPLDLLGREGHVDTVVVIGKLTYQEVIPAQSLKGALLERLNTHSVADALRYFSGLQLKDYGGVGGLKTVNIRSMGTNHLGIYYDGIALGNAQNGQIDLGQFSLDNVQEVSLYHGQKSAIFQTASDFGNAGSVYIRTRQPVFAEGKPYNLKFKLKYGSSDMVRFSTLWDRKISDDISSSLSAELLNSSGKYRFRYRRMNMDHTVAYDTTATRHNGDIWAARVEANLHGILAQGRWLLKAYSYNSERGIPGAIVNNVWRRGERQWDHNHFVQGSWQKSYGERFSTRWQAKYAYYNTRYVNNDTTQMHVDNTYRQQELYVSTSNVYELLRNWSVSLSYDFRWNKLDADMTNFSYPRRYSHYVALASALDLRRLKLQGSLLWQSDDNHTRKNAASRSNHGLTPAFFASFYPFDSRVFSLRAFVKKSYRMPTFNDLYYTEVGNADLKPESALQYDMGFMVDKAVADHGPWRHFRLQVDAYYNSVRDKIVAYPKGQQFRWTMLNLGRVHIAGVDAEAELTMQPLRGLMLTGRVQYTYQDARDVTDPTTSYYRDQIPYIPWHSGSAIVMATYGHWDLSYSFIYSGERYNQQENTQYNHMQPWYTHDLSLMYRFRWRWADCKVTAEVNNVFGQDYDVILNYPMPKRTFAIGIDLTI